MTRTATKTKKSAQVSPVAVASSPVAEQPMLARSAPMGEPAAERGREGERLAAAQEAPVAECLAPESLPDAVSPLPLSEPVPNFLTETARWAEENAEQPPPSALRKDAPLPKPIVASDRLPIAEKEEQPALASKPPRGAAFADEPKPSADELFPQRIWPD